MSAFAARKKLWGATANAAPGTVVGATPAVGSNATGANPQDDGPSEVTTGSTTPIVAERRRTRGSGPLASTEVRPLRRSPAVPVSNHVSG